MARRALVEDLMLPARGLAPHQTGSHLAHQDGLAILVSSELLLGQINFDLLVGHLRGKRRQFGVWNWPQMLGEDEVRAFEVVKDAIPDIALFVLDGLFH